MIDTNYPTLVATFAINSYTVSASAEAGGSVDDLGGTYNYQDGPTITATADAGYTFDGWTGGGTACTTEAVCDLSMIDTNYPTLVATFALSITYTVDYDTNGGDATLTQDTSTDGASITLPSPGVLADFIFDGWYEAEDLSGSSVGDDGDSYVPAANVTLYAKWVATVTYTVDYDTNGGDATLTQDTSTDGASVTLPSPGLLADSYFDGWYEAEDLSGSEVGDAGDEYVPSANVTLYAKWVATITYTVDYDTNGGDATLTQDTSTDGASITLPSPGVLADFIFDGWYEAEDLSGSEVGDAGDPYVPTGNVTLYAKWVADTGETYTVDYDTNGGDATLTQDTSTDGASITLPSPGVLADFIFDGWYEAEDLSGSEVGDAGDPYVPTGNVTLYAKWVADTGETYTVDYDTNGGDAALSQDTSTDGSAVNLPSPGTRSGYTFSGWYDNEGLTGSEVGDAGDPYVPSANVTLYAKWTPTGGGGGGGGGGSGPAPVNNVLPTITGSTSAESIVTANVGTWSNSNYYTYQWYYCTTASAGGSATAPLGCVRIGGATFATYTVEAAYSGSYLSVRIRAIGDGGSTDIFSATSAAVGVGEKPFSVKAVPPRIVGFAAIGQLLTAKRGQWIGAPTTYAYQWYRCTKVGLKSPRSVPTSCTLITGANAKRYTVTAADAGFFLRARVTATGAAGQGFRMSRSTGLIAN